jgi:transcription elongation factor S-II
MDKELVDLFESAKKAADAAATASDGGSEVSRCLDALKLLKNFPITYDILVSTQVGKKLRPLNKHPNEKIQSMASELLEVWKKMVIEETARKKKDGTVDNKANNVKVEKIEKTTTVTVNAGSVSRSVKVEEILNAESVKVEKMYKGESTKHGSVSRSETVEAEKMDKGAISKVEKKPSFAPPKLTTMVKCNDAARDKLREILVEALSKVASEADEDIMEEVRARDPIRIAVSVECALFEKWGRSNGAQKFKYRSIMFNLKDAKNPDFRRKVLLGQVKPEWLTDMTPEEMASDQRQQENNKIKEKALFECERGQPPKATTDEFKCSRCLQRKCVYHQMQTRSADEPMTTYVTCVNCGKNWKFC